jgi:ABC-type transport system substrate-binding protein
MPFFAPIPFEAERFYSQRGMNDGRNLTLNWYPVGTGPYMLTENNPNARMVLERNPNFRGEPFPAEGAPSDRPAGLLKDAGKSMPFIDRVVFSREKEGIPYWNKFLQGYYDRSGIASDNFDQAVQFSVEGQATLTPEMERKEISLRTSVSTSTFYLAFNFLDPVVGGLSERARKLRQAISIAVDFEEFISIFANGRGIPGMGPIPPGLFGYREGPEGVNHVVYDWVDGKPKRKARLRVSCWPTPGMLMAASSRNKANRSCSTWTRCRVGRATARVLPGTAASSPRSTSSSRSAQRTGTVFRRRFVPAIRNCSFLAGMRIIPIPRTSCSS